MGSGGSEILARGRSYDGSSAKVIPTFTAALFKDRDPNLWTSDPWDRCFLVLETLTRLVQVLLYSLLAPETSWTLLVEC